MKTAQHFSLKKYFAILGIASLVLVSLAQIALIPSAYAASLTNAYVRYDRMAAATATNVLVVFKPNTITSVNTVKITFGTASLGGTCTTSVSNLPSGVTALPGTLSCAVSGQTVTITGVTTLATATNYGVNIATGVTTGGAGSTTDNVATYATSTPVESIDVAVEYVASNNDQITVNATVAPTFSFTLGANTDSFTSTLSSSAVRATSGVTVTVATNALNGWTGWVKDSNQGLTSTLASNTIATTGTVNGTPQSVSAGTEGYGLCAAAGTGSPTIDAEYAGTCNTSGTTVGALASTLQPFATGSGPTSSQIVTLKEYAAISGTTKAASDYTDTLTVVGAANF